MEDKRKLTRSMSDKAILGVCSGFAKYFDIDPIIVRLTVVLLALFGTLGVWFYILAAIIMPRDTDMVYSQSQPRYDTETGRPLYEAGGAVYENRAGGAYPNYSQPAPETQEAEFRSEPYSAQQAPENAEAAESAQEAGEQGFESNPATGEAGDTSGSWTEPPRQEAPKQEAPAQDPYRNFQGCQAGSQQTQKTYQAQPQPQPERQVPRRNRNTGILMIIIGLIILMKIILPKINVWIPIAVGLIFFGIFLCCRKK